VTSAQALIPLVVERVRAGVQYWKQSGKAPPDLAAAEPAAAQHAQAAAPAAQPQAQMMSLDSLEADLGPGTPVDSKLAAPLGAQGARIHTGPVAQKKASEHDAVAFAVGPNVVMGANAPAAGTAMGDALLAHELAHTAQQKDAAKDPVARMMPIGGESQAAERDADQHAAGAIGQEQKLATLGNFAGRVGDVMRTGLQLQRCGSAEPAKVEQQLNGEAKVPPPLNVTFGDDLFLITFGQTGANDKPQLALDIKYTGKFPFESTNNNAPNVTVTQPLTQPGPLDVAVKQVESSGLLIDTLRNDFDLVKLTDTQSFAGDKKARRHDFQTKLFGTAGTAATFWIKDPKAHEQKEDKGPAIQGDTPGEATRTQATGKHNWQLRLDVDGDQYKESLLEVNLLETHPNGAAKSVELAVTQLDSKTRLVAPPMAVPDSGHQFDFPFLGPTYSGTDGSGPTIVRYASQPKGELWLDAPFLTISLPVTQGDKSVITLSAAGYSAPLTFPKHEVVKNDSAIAPKKLAGFWTTDLTLGPYHDKFRLTIEPMGNDATQANVVVAAMTRGKPSFALAVPAKLPPAGLTSVDVLAHEGVGVKLDLDGDKKPDVELYLGIGQEHTLESDIDPEQWRDLNLRVRGSAIAKDALLEFEFKDGQYSTDQHLGHEADYAKVHENDPIVATTTLADEQKLDTFAKVVDSYEVMMNVERKKAVDKKVISKELYDAWSTLSTTVIQITPAVATVDKTPVDAALQSSATAQATALYQQLVHDTPKTTGHVIVPYYGSYDENKYTGERFNSSNEMLSNGGGSAKSLSGAFQGAHDKAAWQAAIRTYRQVVQGVDQWIIDQTKKSEGENSPTAQKIEYMQAMQKELGDIAEHKPMPLHAVFYPDPANFNDEKKEAARKSPTEVPLSIFVWSEGEGENQTWHIRDLTNPNRPFEDTGKKAKDEKFPSHTLLQDELDAKIHFPKGQILYQFPDGGPGGKVVTHANKKWYEWFEEAAMIAMVVGLGLVTAGGAVAVAGGVVLAASGVAGAIAAGGDMADHIHHGALDGTTFTLDALAIVTGVFGAGEFAAGRVIVRETAAAAEIAEQGATKIKPPPAWLSQAAKQAFIPLKAANLGGAALQLLVVTDAAMAQMKELDKLAARGGDPEEIKRARLQLVANLAIQGGFTMLAIKGELPTLREGMNLIVTMKGETPVAHVEGEIDPTTIKFSQENIGGATSDGISIGDLTSSMNKEGWKGDPIQVVQLEDGSLVSLDNRRLYAARKAMEAGGIKGKGGVPTEVHAANEPIPQDWASEAFVSKKNVYRLSDGTLTTEKTEGAELVIKKGQVATTYGEAVTIRSANQGNIQSEGANKGKKFPLTGSIDEPRIRQPKGGATGPEAKVTDNDVDQKPALQVDPSNDAARIQTKSINSAIQEGQIDLDWNKKNKAGTTTLGQEYQKWIESPEPVDFSGKTPKANYKGDPEFAATIDGIVAKGNITLNLKAQANAHAAESLQLKSLDPASPTYAADRAKLVEKFGAEAVARYEHATLGDATDPARKKIFEQVDKIVGPEAITQLRNAFPGCEIYITGSASQPSKGKPADLAKITDLDVVIVVPEGTDGPGRALYEDRAKTLQVPTSPEFAQATGKSSLPVDASARTKSQMLGLMTTPTPTDAAGKPRTPLEYARVDANLPENAPQVRENLAAAEAAGAKKPTTTPTKPPEVPKSTTKEGLIDSLADKKALAEQHAHADGSVPVESVLAETPDMQPGERAKQIAELAKVRDDLVKEKGDIIRDLRDTANTAPQDKVVLVRAEQALEAEQGLVDKLYDAKVALNKAIDDKLPESDVARLRARVSQLIRQYQQHLTMRKSDYARYSMDVETGREFFVRYKMITGHGLTPREIADTRASSGQLGMQELRINATKGNNLQPIRDLAAEVNADNEAAAKAGNNTDVSLILSTTKSKSDSAEHRQAMTDFVDEWQTNPELQKAYSGLDNAGVESEKLPPSLMWKMSAERAFVNAEIVKTELKEHLPAGERDKFIQSLARVTGKSDAEAKATLDKFEATDFGAARADVKARNAGDKIEIDETTGTVKQQFAGQTIEDTARTTREVTDALRSHRAEVGDARQLPAQLGYTVHAGEQLKNMDPFELLKQVEESISLGADRIGHGLILGIKPEELIAMGKLKPADVPRFLERQAAVRQHVKDAGVVIEVNITSNTQISNLDAAAHPASGMVNDGVRVSVSTDDETVLATTVKDELKRLAQAKGVTRSDVAGVILEGYYSRMGTRQLADRGRLKAQFFTSLTEGLKPVELEGLANKLAKQFHVGVVEDNPNATIHRVLDAVFGTGG
jgi:hypothetical protein